MTVTGTVFCFSECTIFSCRQNATMLAELQRGLPPLQVNEEAAMRELCEFLKKNPRLLQAVMLELSPAPGSPMTDPRQKRHVKEN